MCQKDAFWFFRLGQRRELPPPLTFIFQFAYSVGRLPLKKVEVFTTRFLFMSLNTGKRDWVFPARHRAERLDEGGDGTRLPPRPHDGVKC